MCRLALWLKCAGYHSRNIESASVTTTAGKDSNSVRFRDTRFNMAPRISVPRSHIYEWYVGQCSCPKCGELLGAPAYSEFLKRNNVRHTWACNKCDYEFETLIWLNVPPGGSWALVKRPISPVRGTYQIKVNLRVGFRHRSSRYAAFSKSMTSVLRLWQRGHSKVRRAQPDLSGSMRISHIGAPHLKQTGRAGVVSRSSPNQTIGASAYEAPRPHP